VLAGLAAVLALVIGITAALAAEEIRSFDARIEVLTSGTLVVTETITVNAEGRDIRRGIFRDIPLLFEEDGQVRRAGLDVVSVTRDGADEPYATERLPEGIRIRIGDADVIIPTGVHTYVIRYETTRQVLNFEDHDEVYWNATGNDWDFPILRATAEVILPEGVTITDRSVYTGAYGGKGGGATASGEGNVARFETAERLAPGQGMTISVSFPTGVVVPSAIDEMFYALADRRNEIIAGLGLVLVGGFYGWSWNKVGRDPRKGTIIPLFSAPEGMSPGLAHYVRNKSGGGNWTALSATAVGLAVKGLLVFEDLDGKMRMERTEKQVAEPLSESETLLLSRIESRFGGSLTIDKSNGEEIKNLGMSFRSSLGRESGGRHFRFNVAYIAIGIVLSIVVALAYMALGDPESAPILTFGGAFALVAANVAGAWLLFAPTTFGRKQMDDIEGLERYLSVAERDRLNMAGAPEMSPTRFETLLPYAVALGVEKPWADAFQGWLASAAAGAAAAGYQPGWYRGRRFDSRDFGSSMGRMVGGMASSFRSSVPVPKSSSSGSRGGGFSGGGRGGGGGGGW
jgi:hypothetical protein